MTDWTRPRPRIRKAFVLACVLGAGATAATFAYTCSQPAQVVTIVVPSLAPQVKVAVPAPTIVAAPLPPPPPPPAPPEPVPPPPPRARAPHIYAGCLSPVALDEPNPTVCRWDTGFPAISADGKTVAIEYRPNDTGRGNP